MASYALSVFTYSAPEKAIGFSAKIYQDDFKAFFSTAYGWGLYDQRLSNNEAEFSIELMYGSLPLKRLELPPIDIEWSKVIVTINEEEIRAKVGVGKDITTITFNLTVIRENQRLKVSVFK